MSKNNATKDEIEERFLFPSERDDSTDTMNTTTVRVDKITSKRLGELVDKAKSDNNKTKWSKRKILNGLVYAAWSSEQGGDSNQGGKL